MDVLTELAVEQVPSLFLQDNVDCSEWESIEAASQFHNHRNIDIKYWYITTMLDADIVKVVHVWSMK